MSLRGPALQVLRRARSASFGLGNFRGLFLQSVFCLFWTLKILYPPKGLCKAENRRRSNCFYLCFIVLGNVYWTFFSKAVSGLFWTFKMFYPPKGLCEAEPEWGPFDNSFHLLCLEKGVGTFKFSGGERPFWNLENVLSPEGTLQSRYRRRSNCFYLCLILS